MQKIITVIKNNKKTKRLGRDAAQLLDNLVIKTSKPSNFIEEVIRKLHRSIYKQPNPT